MRPKFCMSTHALVEAEGITALVYTVNSLAGLAMNSPESISSCRISPAIRALERRVTSMFNVEATAP